MRLRLVEPPSPDCSIGAATRRAATKIHALTLLDYYSNTTGQWFAHAPYKISAVLTFREISPLLPGIF
jgi:hypothetical protein